MSQANNRKGFYPADINAVPTTLPIGTAQTLTKGDAVILSSGLVKIAEATSAELAGIIAQDVAAPAANTLVKVWGPNNPDMEFIGRMDGSTTYVAGGDVDLTGTTGAMQLDANATSTNVFLLLRKHPDDVQGAGERWYVRINKNAFANTSS